MATIDQPDRSGAEWNGWQKVVFRIIFIYFFLQIVPLDWKYYLHLAGVDWLHLSFRDIFNIAKYTPQFTSSVAHGQDWGQAGFADWGFIFLLALVGGLFWSWRDKECGNYVRLYYYLLVLVRYRLAIGVIAYGFLKVFALQAPYPSVSSLNTPYGDFTSWKLFSLSLGIVPGYQSFLGVVELVAGLFLLFRKTAPVGAIIIVFFTGNVFMSNLAYEGGDVVYSFYLVVLALFIVVYYAEQIINLLILAQPAAPVIVPISWSGSAKKLRWGLKSMVVLVFVVFYGISVYGSAVRGNYHFSTQPGLKGLTGLYTVNSFSVDGRVLPASLLDSIRWQDVVFEKWATLSIKVNDYYLPVNYNGEGIPSEDGGDAFESTATTGRHYYSYQADTTKHLMVLTDLTSSGKRAGQLSYSLESDSTVVLKGNVNGKAVEAILQKNNKKYLLKASEKGRRGSLKL